MRRLLYAAVAGVSFAVAALGLPADLVVISDREVRPDEAAAFYYLGQAAGGYLYNGSSATVGRVAPYRVLDRDAQMKDYYIVWAPGWVNVKAEAFAHLGTSVRLSEYEILVGLERGFGPGALRAVEHRIELCKLEPVTPVDWRYDGEAPPTKKDPVIEGAINSITAGEYAGYIKKLQDFKTRWTDTPGCDAARDYIRGFFASQGVESSLFPFKAVEFYGAPQYPGPGSKMYLRTDHGSFKRSKDNGTTWDTIWPEDVYPASSFWLDADTGFVAGYNEKMAKTTDGGETWNVVAIRPESPKKYEYKPWGICFVTGDVGWLGGESSSGPGFMFKTTDGGETWAEQKVPDAFEATAIDFFDASRGWAAGGRGGSGRGILYTDDGGTTWRKCTMPATLRMQDLAAVGPGEGWATTRDSGEILHTTDAVTWRCVDPGVAGIYKEVEFPDASHGYAAGTKIIKTDDGGATWREVTTAPQIAYDLFAFADKDHGIVGDEKAEHLYRTDDGGRSFVSIIDGIDLTVENVIGERRGCEAPEEIIIIGGHFDSVSEIPVSYAPGADDNASGTACAMAAARAFRDLAFKRTVRYVAFGAEESGLVGSGAYAKHCAAKGEKVVAVLNADMVAYDEEGGARDDYVIAYDKYDWLFDYVKTVGGFYGQDLIYETGTCGSDQYSFWSVGYAAIGAIEGSLGPGGHQSYPYYHTAEDTLDKLHPTLGVRFVRDYAAALAHLAGFDDTGVEDPRPGAAAPFARPFAVYPNPYCYATSTGGVNFVGVRSPAAVEIYDLAGRRVGRGEVAAGRDAWVWNAAAGGRAPGVYLYRVEGQEQKKAGKIVVAK